MCIGQIKHANEGLLLELGAKKKKNKTTESLEGRERDCCAVNCTGALKCDLNY